MTIRRSALGGGGGPFFGARAPIPVAGVGATYPPSWAAIDSATFGFNTTATRLYYIPFYFPRAGFVYTGMKMRNAGAGDNGEVLRLGAYEASSSTGLPSSLIQDCGEVTLTGAAADRSLAVSVTAPYEGWGYFASHFNSAVAVPAMSSRLAVSAVGQYHADEAMNMFGGVSLARDFGSAGFGAYYVDTTYGALAASAVAPTAFTTVAPATALYRT